MTECKLQTFESFTNAENFGDDGECQGLHKLKITTLALLLLASI